MKNLLKEKLNIWEKNISDPFQETCISFCVGVQSFGSFEGMYYFENTLSMFFSLKRHLYKMYCINVLISKQ